MSQLKTHILHQEYLLTCPEGQESQLQEAVERVDQQFQQMRNSTKLRSRERICVLLAVNLAFENLVLRNQLQELQQQLATAQANDQDSLIHANTERLATLEAQAHHDQVLATQLQLRLDHVLTDDLAALQEIPAPPVSVTAQADGIIPDTHSDNLDNAEHMELALPPIESL